MLDLTVHFIKCTFFVSQIKNDLVYFNSCFFNIRIEMSTVVKM